MIGRYEILREIGLGGTAVVYLARQTDLGRLVALKELSLPRDSDGAASRRFVRESQLVAALNHPNVVTVHDFFERDGTSYIAMEYFERGSLRPLMRDLGLARIAGVLEGLLGGLGHAHANGIVHRDLKPENVMVTRDGAVKIADFGIAKATGEALATTHLTATGTTVGTPAYMAPEQALGDEIGPRTDLYALGVVAFELFAGRAPFGARETPAAVLLRHVNEPPPALVTIVSGIDPRLSAWVDRLLEKAPEDRPPSTADAWLELEEILIERLGSRWRRAAALPDAPAATPATLPLAPATPGKVDLLAPTLLPPAPAVAPAIPEARPARRRPRRRRATWQRLRAAMLVAALAAALASVLGGGGGGVESGPPVAPAASRAPAGSAPVTPSRRGVGDSESDDPSDDEPDIGEP